MFTMYDQKTVFLKLFLSAFLVIVFVSFSLAAEVNGKTPKDKTSKQLSAEQCLKNEYADCNNETCKKCLQNKCLFEEKDLHIDKLEQREIQILRTLSQTHLPLEESKEIYKDLKKFKNFFKWAEDNQIQKYKDEGGDINIASMPYKIFFDKVSKVLTTKKTLNTKNNSDNQKAYDTALKAIYDPSLKLQDTGNDDYEILQKGAQFTRIQFCKMVKEIAAKQEGISSELSSPCDNLTKNAPSLVPEFYTYDTFLNSDLGKFFKEIIKDRNEFYDCLTHTRENDPSKLKTLFTVKSHSSCETYQQSQLKPAHTGAKCKPYIDQAEASAGRINMKGKYVRIEEAKYYNGRCDALAYVKSECEENEFAKEFCLIQKEDGDAPASGKACLNAKKADKIIDSKTKFIVNELKEEERLKVCRFIVNAKQICHDEKPAKMLKIKYKCKDDGKVNTEEIKDGRKVSLDCRNEDNW